MRARGRSRLTLIVSLLALAGLACSLPGQAAPTVDPNIVALAVQQTLQASGEGPSGPPPATIPVATEAPSPPTDTPLVPTPTVVHVVFPANPGGTTSFMTDRSSAALAGERRSIGDNLDTNLLERPFTANVMDYRGYLDINRGELSIGAPWIYVTFYLEQAPPAGTPAFYGVEVDIDIDGRGDWMIVGAAPPTTDWTTNGVRVLRDTNNDVGAAHPMASDAPSGGNGYDELVFDQGQGSDPDAAWIRLAPGSATQVQVAFKYMVIGSPNTWTWGVWADEGVNKPEWLDYNDHFTAAEAGSPTSGTSNYPIKALAAVDNSCRWAVGFTPVGTEPGICPVPPTPTPTSTPTTAPVDRQPPSVQVLHAPASIFEFITSVTFTATAGDNVAVTRIRIYVQGPGEGSPTLVQTCSNTTTCTFTGGPYSGGQGSYFATAEDAALNLATSGTKTFWAAAS